MDLKYLYFSAEGRIKRQPYWLGSIPLVVIQIIVEIAVESTGNPTFAFINLILIWPGVMISIKRCHDLDRSGWFSLVLIIPIVQLWPMVELGFFQGTAGPNKFGENPLAESGG